MIKSLEGGRGIAALIVAIYHLAIGANYFSVIRNGYLFVDLFFVLSGFVICGAYSPRMKTMGEFQSFLIRRIGRLLPLLIASTIIYLLAANLIVLAKQIAYSSGYAGALRHPGAREYLIPGIFEITSVLTMTHGMGVFDRLILNTPSWSISTEFYTYLLFAAVCLLLNGRIRLAAFALLSIAGFAITTFASANIHDCLRIGGCLSVTYDFGFPRTVFSFFLGALTFHISRAVRVNVNVLQIVGAVALAAAFLLVDTYYTLAFAFPFVFALLIVSVCNDRGWMAGILTSRPFQVLGERSYSIYLMHVPLAMFFENFAGRVQGVIGNTLLLLLYVTTLIIISGWTYRFIEDPFRSMFNRIATGSRVLRADPAN
jgi:peptidoglycan/LPS O-acetylase OafA/YrhL